MFYLVNSINTYLRLKIVFLWNEFLALDAY